MKNIKKGFTLIELLVVVAIIGILAAVVLASLNSARTKGADAAIKSSLANMRAQAALYYDNNSSSYGTGTAVSSGTLATCIAAGSVFADPTITAALTQVNGQAGAFLCTTTGNPATSFSIAAVLKSSGTGATNATGAASQTGGYGIYCVDSNGSGKVNSTATTLAGALTSGLCN